MTKIFFKKKVALIWRIFFSFLPFWNTTSVSLTVFKSPRTIILLHSHNSHALIHSSFDQGQDLIYCPASIYILKWQDKASQHILFTQACDCHLIILPQLLLLVSLLTHINPRFYICATINAQYISKGKNQNKLIFLHDTLSELQLTPPPTPDSICLMVFVALTICAPWTVLPGTAVQKSIHIYISISGMYFYCLTLLPFSKIQKYILSTLSSN